MSVTKILSPDEGVPLLDRARFEAEARERFPDGVVVPIEDERRTSDVVVRFQRPDTPSFQIFHSRYNDVIWTDAPPEEAAEVALWVASLLPEDPGGRIWFCDEHFTGHVELRRGITRDQLREGWVDHAEHEPEFRTNADREDE